MLPPKKFGGIFRLPPNRYAIPKIPRKALKIAPFSSTDYDSIFNVLVIPYNNRIVIWGKSNRKDIKEND